MKKKIVALGLTVCMILSASGTVFGVTGMSGELAAAVKAAKAIITIPDAYTEFDYYTYEEQNGEGKTELYWELLWYDKDYNGEISVTLSQNYQLHYFSHYNYNQEWSELSSLSYSEAEKIAKTFLKKVIPNDADQMILNKTEKYYTGSSYDFYYTFYQNDLPVYFKQVNVEVDKSSGQVNYFYRLYDDDVAVSKYLLPGQLLSNEAAVERYVQNYGIPIAYLVSRDYKTNTLMPISAYCLDGGGKAIDAMTGEPVELYADDNYGWYYGSNNNLGRSLYFQTGEEFSDSEAAQFVRTEKLISKQQAISYVEKQAPDGGSWKDVEYMSLSCDDFDQSRYYWYLYSSDIGWAEVDARTGELLSYYKYYGYSEATGTKNISISTAQTEVERFLKNISADRFANVKAEPAWIGYDDYIYFDYVRQENDLPVYGNGISVVYDKSTGKIQRYDCVWDQQITFPINTSVINEAEAFNAAAKAAGFEAMYMLTEKNKANVVYYFSNPESVYIDPSTGARINSDGSYKALGVTSYDDIAGKWYENIVKTLLENGYYIDDQSFNGAEQITQETFFQFLFSDMRDWYSSTDEFYDDLVMYGVIKTEEIAPDSFIMKQDAAKFIVRLIGFEGMAEKPEIFSIFFHDYIEREYVGYAAIAYSWGIITGDSKGNFNGTKLLTKAEAAVIIYNYLKAQ